jgi:hypothetical protein
MAAKGSREAGAERVDDTPAGLSAKLIWLCKPTGLVVELVVWATFNRCCAPGACTASNGRFAWGKVLTGSAAECTADSDASCSPEPGVGLVAIDGDTVGRLVLAAVAERAAAERPRAPALGRRVLSSLCGGVWP